jgi:hypothetical protein
MDNDMEKIKISIENESRAMTLELPWDAGSEEMINTFVTMMSWLTFPQGVTEKAMAGYLEERGWDVTKEEEEE